MRHLLLLLAISIILLGCGAPQPIPPAVSLIEPESVVPRPIPQTMGVMFDWGWDDLQEITGVIASPVHFETWDRVAPGPGQFNSGPLDAVMARYRGQTVTLADGTTIPVPVVTQLIFCLLYTSPSPRDRQRSRMPCNPPSIPRPDPLASHAVRLAPDIPTVACGRQSPRRRVGWVRQRDRI